MDERTSLSRRKLLHTWRYRASSQRPIWLVGCSYIWPAQGWGAEPVRFSGAFPEPTRIALMNSLASASSVTKDFAVQIEYVPQAQAASEAHQRDHRRKSARSLPGLDNWVGQFNGMGAVETSPRARNAGSTTRTSRDGLARP